MKRRVKGGYWRGLVLAGCLLAMPVLSAETVWRPVDEVARSPEVANEEVAFARQLLKDRDASRLLRAQARSIMRLRAREGNPVACYYAAMSTSDAREATDWLRTAARAGIAESAEPLADLLYRHGRGSQEDFAEARALYVVAAGRGGPSAQFYLGRMNHFGDGGPRDYAEARRWYQAAAQQGDRRAANNLGNLLADGLGGPPDLEAGMASFRQASEAGMAMASYNLAQRYRQDVPGAPDWGEAARYYRLAWEQSEERDGDSAYWLGIIAEYGHDGSAKDIARAREYYQAAAERGDGGGEYRLGLCYEHGRGVEKNLAQAFEHYQRGADDSTGAAFKVGWFYDSGQLGVPDEQAAIRYYRQAARGGHVQAKSNLALLLEPSGPEGDWTEVERLYREAIKAGNTYAMNNYGQLHAFHKLPDYDEAYGVELLLAAARDNHRLAVENLVYYYDGWGDIAPAQPEKAAYWRQRLAELP